MQGSLPLPLIVYQLLLAEGQHNWMGLISLAGGLGVTCEVTCPLGRCRGPQGVLPCVGLGFWDVGDHGRWMLAHQGWLGGYEDLAGQWQKIPSPSHSG